MQEEISFAKKGIGEVTKKGTGSFNILEVPTRPEFSAFFAFLSCLLVFHGPTVY